MGEMNKCIRCGKPCNSGETMCDECKAWFQNQVGTPPVKPKDTSRSGKEKVTAKPVKPQGEKKQQKSKTIPLIVLGIVAMCLVVVGIVFFMGRKDKEKSENIAVQDTGTDKAAETGEAKEEPEEEQTQEPVWEEADVDAIQNEFCTFQGKLTGQQLALVEPVSIYLMDSQGNKVFVKRVQHIKLLDESGRFDLPHYKEAEANAVGKMFYDEDGTVAMILDNMEAYMPEAEVTPIVAERNEEGIHEYEFVLKDCSWNEAFNESIQKGGYLVHINSQEEYNHILNLMASKGLQKKHFYLGGRREADGQDYYWVDNNNQIYGEPLNSSTAWCASAWMGGEPSYEDPELHITEMYVNTFYYSKEGRVVWSDGPEDIAAAVSAFKGKVGYIVEYER